MRIAARPNCTTNPERDADCDGTTLANTEALAIEASFIHRYADDAQTPNRSATTRGVSPVAFTSAISRSRASAVCRLRMRALCGARKRLNRWASRSAYKAALGYLRIGGRLDD